MSLQQYYHPFLKNMELRGVNQVSNIGFGTVKIGRNQKIKNKSPDGFKLPSLEEIDELISLAIEHGINFIDTAPAYGVSEKVLGQTIGSRRKNLFISTKVGEDFDGDTSQYDFTKNHTIKSVESSLRNLNTDYLDSVLVHCPREDLEVLKNSSVLEDLSLLKEKGSILSFGASTNSLEGGLYAAQHCDSVMVSYNILYKQELEVITKAQELGKGIIIKKGLLQGHLDKVLANDPIEACLTDIFYTCPNSTVVLGTTNPKHLLANIKSAINALQASAN